MSKQAQILIDKTNAYIAWLRATQPVVLEHLRSLEKS